MDNDDDDNDDQGHCQEFTKGGPGGLGTDVQGQNMETLDNTNGAVTKLTYGDKGRVMHPCPPTLLATSLVVIMMIMMMMMMMMMMMCCLSESMAVQCDGAWSPTVVTSQR